MEKFFSSRGLYLYLQLLVLFSFQTVFALLDTDSDVLQTFRQAVRVLGGKGRIVICPAGQPVDPRSLAYARCALFSSLLNKNTATTYGDIRIFGVPGGTRTPDFHVRNVAFYPLNYGHTCNRNQQFMGVL